jgi:hypothetical protein
VAGQPCGAGERTQAAGSAQWLGFQALGRCAYGCGSWPARWGRCRPRALDGPRTRCFGPQGAEGGKGFLLFLFDFSLFLSFIYFYSNLDIVFESKIQIHFLSLNGCTTTTIEHTIKYLGMLCKNQGKERVTPEFGGY